MIYQQLFVKHDFSSLYQEFRSNISSKTPVFLMLTFLLVFINWTLEIVRWRILVLEHYNISFLAATKGILMGITLGLISPQRIGEYAGRMLALPVAQNSLSIKANFFTSLALNVVIITCGMIGILYFYITQQWLVDFEMKWVLISGIISLFILLFILLKFPFVEKILPFDWFFEKLKTWGNFSQYQFSFAIVLKVLLLSILRYLSFLTQYYLLLKIFGVDLNADILLGAVSIIYLIQSIVPLPGMLSILARGEIAILVFSSFNINDIAIFSSTFSLWIINLMTPALIGLGIIWNTRFLETLGFKK